MVRMDHALTDRIATYNIAMCLWNDIMPVLPFTLLKQTRVPAAPVFQLSASPSSPQTPLYVSLDTPVPSSVFYKSSQHCTIRKTNFARLSGGEQITAAFRLSDSDVFRAHQKRMTVSVENRPQWVERLAGSTTKGWWTSSYGSYQLGWVQNSKWMIRT